MGGEITLARIRGVLVGGLLLAAGLQLLGARVRFAQILPWLYFATFGIAGLLKRLRTRRYLQLLGPAPTPREICEALTASHRACRGPAVVRVTPDGVELASGRGWTGDTLVELGSITKSLTGLTLA